MMKTYSISCHCGSVQANFCREQHLPLTVWDCNCSDCGMRRNLHFMVHASNFWLVDGDGGDEKNKKTDTTGNDDTNDRNASSVKAKQCFERETILYQWGTQKAVRRFCRTCGILPFYIPRSNQDGYAVTYPCVNWGEDGPPSTEIRLFDGVNWEQSHASTGIANETAKDTKTS